MKSCIKVQSGFTLIEVAIVLIIVSILLGYTFAMIPIQQDLKQYQKADAEMNEIIHQLVAFAQVNGRLPCPDSAAGANGLEDTVDLFDNADGNIVGADTVIDGCLAYFGFLPRATLGMNGRVDGQGRLLDPWGEPYGYHVSDIIGANQIVDLVSPNGIREEGLSNVVPDLVVCDDSDNSSAANITCTGVGPDGVSANDVVTGIAAIVISAGKDRGKIASNIQGENRDDFDDGTNDKVYTSSTRSEAQNAEYDDVIKWVSPNLLFSKMIEAGQLP